MWLSHKRGRAQAHGRRCGARPSSGWFGDKQRACPRVEAGETDAAGPGQAETGSADQATREHANVEVSATGLANGRKKGTHTRPHRNRGRTDRREQDIGSIASLTRGFQRSNVV